MSELWHKFITKGFALKQTDDPPATWGSQNVSLKKTLGPLDLLLFGVGSMIGSGVFVLTGQVARDTAGPAVFLSYAIAAVAAMLCGLCYVEFAADVPESGTAFIYLFGVYGEFIAWMSACNMILEYTFAAPSIAKGVASYSATLLGWESDSLLIQFKSVSYISIDVPAFFIVVALSVLLGIGIKGSSIFNAVVTSINIFTIIFTFCYLFQFFDAENITPLAPFKFQGVFHASSIVFFSYLGFDGIATVVEETRDPNKSIPISIIGSISISAVLYVLMALSLVGMVSYKEIDPYAAFSVIFSRFGHPLLSSLVSVGALTGILTSVLGALLGQSRIFMSLGRYKFLPHGLADVHPRTKTPIKATALTCVLAATPALLFKIELLAELVSMGSLFVMALVCSGIIWRSHCTPGNVCSRPTVGALMVLLLMGCLGEGLVSCYGGPLWLHMIFLGLWLAGTVGFKFIPIVYKSSKFNVPLKPFIPSLGVLSTIHLILSMGFWSHLRFLGVQVISIIIYFGYTLHKSPDHSTDSSKLEDLLLPEKIEADHEASGDDTASGST